MERISPDLITELDDNEVFVFGSNIQGHHGGGAAALAFEKFGAEWGKGTGLQGQSYAIPTMHGGVDTIKPYVDRFLEFAKEHKELDFLVTEIGCGIAGFYVSDIAPLFFSAIDEDMQNVYLPKRFVDEYNKTKNNRQ